MTDAATDAFLSGRGIPVDPRRIEPELTRLWGPAAERAGADEADNPNVTRVVLANLVVEADAAAAPAMFATLDAVIARVPSRSIVVARTTEPGRAVAAEVAALCHLPAPGLPQVCSERIILRAGPSALDLIPGAVRSLLEPNLPVVLWWTGDPRPVEPLFRALARDATRLILDLPDPGADPGALRLGLDPAVNAHARDSAWFGIARWRELIAQFFDGPDGRDALARVSSVTIEAAVGTPGPAPRLPVWIAAWLAGQLGWTPAGEVAAAPGRIDAAFRSGRREVAVAIRAEADPGMEGVALRSVTLETTPGEGPSSFRLARPAGRPGEVRVEICSDRTCALPRVVVIPEVDAPRRISAGLESSRHDEPFRRALPHALRLLS